MTSTCQTLHEAHGLRLVSDTISSAVQNTNSQITPIGITFCLIRLKTKIEFLSNNGKIYKKLCNSLADVQKAHLQITLPEFSNT